MATEPWPLGTDSGERLRAEVRTFLKTWLFDDKYKPRLPRKQHLTILDEGKRESAGITIRVVSANDPRPPWPYRKGQRTVSEDWHQVALFVKADRASGGADSVSAVFGALRAMFATRDEMPERSALEEAGIHECMETPEGIIVDAGNPDEEGIAFKQQINLRCNTDTYLD